jgi:hypothetical protein
LPFDDPTLSLSLHNGAKIVSRECGDERALTGGDELQGWMTSMTFRLAYLRPITNSDLHIGDRTSVHAQPISTDIMEFAYGFTLCEPTSHLWNHQASPVLA